MSLSFALHASVSKHHVQRQITTLQVSTLTSTRSVVVGTDRRRRPSQNYRRGSKIVAGTTTAKIKSIERERNRRPKRPRCDSAATDKRLRGVLNALEWKLFGRTRVLFGFMWLTVIDQKPATNRIVHVTQTTSTLQNKAFIDIRLRPGIATPLVVVGWGDVEPSTHRHTVHYSQTWRHPQNWKHMTSQRRQRRTEARSQVICTKNREDRSSGYRECDMFADRQTDTQTSWSQYSPYRGGVIIPHFTIQMYTLRPTSLY